MTTDPGRTASREQPCPKEDPGTPLVIFDSSWTLLALCALGAVVGVTTVLTGVTDTGVRVAAGLGAVGGIAIHFFGRGLLWAYLAWAAVRTAARTVVSSRRR